MLDESLLDVLPVESVALLDVLVEPVVLVDSVGAVVAVGAVAVSAVGAGAVSVLSGTVVASIGATRPASVVDAVVVEAVGVDAVSVTELGAVCGCVAVHCWITSAAGLRVQSVRSTPRVSWSSVLPVARSRVV